MQRPRRISRAVHVGSVQVGGGAPISVQSMTVSKTHDVETSLAEIRELAEAGADIVRVAVPRPEDVSPFRTSFRDRPCQSSPTSISTISMRWRQSTPVWRRCASIPEISGKRSGSRRSARSQGGRYSDSHRREFGLAREGYHGQVWISSARGSLRKCDAARRDLLAHGFEDIIISVKHSDVFFMIQAYRLLAERTDFPLHLGVTESGSLQAGSIKSSIGIGSLLADGIGDTIRVSLTTNRCTRSRSATRS
jgi:(E)-4-hydroxy-3-methylbut-2-enyl-diphosphate synthase